MVDKNFIGLDKPDITRFESYLPTAFSSELTLLQKVNKIIQDLNRSFDLTNEMVEYLNNFVEMFDEKLYGTIEDVLTVWLEDGLLADIVREAINDEVIEARTDYLGKKYVNLKERLDIEKAEVTAQLEHNANQLKDISFNLKSFGAKGDGLTDDTIAIQNAIDFAQRNGYKHIKLPKGIYSVAFTKLHGINYSALEIGSNTVLEMDKEAFLVAIGTSYNNTSVIRIKDATNVSILGGNIIGERFTHIGTGGEWGFGIAIYNSSNINIKDVTIKNTWGDGIYTGGLNDTDLCNNIDISNCDISNCRRQGISITIGDTVKIRNCKIYNINGTAPQSAIDIETNYPAYPVKNVEISGCTFYDNVTQDIVLGNTCENIIIKNNFFLLSTRGIYEQGVNVVFGKKVLIEGNIFLGKSFSVVIQENTESIQVLNNNSEGYLDTGKYKGHFLTVNGSPKSLEVISNTILRSSNAISIGGFNILVQDNNIKDIQTDAIVIYGGTGFNVKQNMINNVIDRYGINAKGTNIDIVANSITNCGTNFINIVDTVGINIMDNTFKDTIGTLSEIIVATVTVQKCVISSNVFDSVFDGKKAVKASWATAYPVMILNNIARYTASPFNLFTGAHLKQNNIDSTTILNS